MTTSGKSRDAVVVELTDRFLSVLQRPWAFVKELGQGAYG